VHAIFARRIKSGKWGIASISIGHLVRSPCGIPLPEPPNLRVVEADAELEQGEMRILPVGMIPHLPYELVGLVNATCMLDMLHELPPGIRMYIHDGSAAL